MSQRLPTGRYSHQMDFLTQTPRDLFFSYTQTGDLLLDSEICEHYGATWPQKQRKEKNSLVKWHFSRK